MDFNPDTTHWLIVIIKTDCDKLRYDRSDWGRQTPVRNSSHLLAKILYLSSVHRPPARFSSNRQSWNCDDCCYHFYRSPPILGPLVVAENFVLPWLRFPQAVPHRCHQKKFHLHRCKCPEFATAISKWAAVIRERNFRFFAIRYRHFKIECRKIIDICA